MKRAYIKYILALLLFGSNGVVASRIGLTSTAHNISIPDELAIIGFDNIMLSRVCEPRLTTISQPRTRIGSIAEEMAAEHIKNPLASIVRVVLDTELVI